MIYYDDDLEEEREPEPRELPEVRLDEPDLAVYVASQTK